MQAWSSVDVPTIPASTDESVPAQLSVFETSSHSVRPVVPAGDTALLYVCGITPYDATHLGHAFTYLTFDLMNRQFRDLGYDVQYVQNVTDVDDPLLERANDTGQDWTELASSQIDLFRSDMTALRVLPPDSYVAATEIIDEVSDLVSTLKDRGLVYQVDDAQYPDWYFRCDQVPTFGDVAGLDRDAMLREFAEHGGDPERPGKQDALDCLVWRMARPGEPSWPSPLGQGRPGWHIECTATALNRLGNTLTVQGGGRDLAFPHHEMCQVEAKAATTDDFAGAYVHVGMVGLDGEKMSKSKGNLELVSRLTSNGFSPMEVRLALLDQHFASDWEWFATSIDDARRRADAWRAAFGAAQGPSAEPVIADLRTALRTNLDAPTALKVIDEWTSAVLSGDGDDSTAPAAVADAVDALLGVRF